MRRAVHHSPKRRIGPLHAPERHRLRTQKTRRGVARPGFWWSGIVMQWRRRRLRPRDAAHEQYAASRPSWQCRPIKTQVPGSGPKATPGQEAIDGPTRSGLRSIGVGLTAGADVGLTAAKSRAPHLHKSARGPMTSPLSIAGPTAYSRSIGEKASMRSE